MSKYVTDVQNRTFYYENGRRVYLDGNPDVVAKEQTVSEHEQATANRLNQLLKESEKRVAENVAKMKEQNWIKCPNCGTLMLDNGTSCRVCGEKPSVGPAIVLIIVIIIFVIILAHFW
jgi:rubrerythrin